MQLAARLRVSWLKIGSLSPAFTIPLLLWAAQAGVESHLAAARKAELAGDFQSAEKEYQQAVSIRPDPEVFQKLGLVRHLQNKYPEALLAFDQAVRLKPDAWGAHLFLGIDYYRTNQFSKALAALVTARGLHPDEPEVQFWLGVTYIALHQDLEGEEILEALSAKQPRNLELLRILAQSYSDSAVALHNRITAEHPDSAWAYLIHGQALENEGFCEAAIGEYRKAKYLRPEMDGIREAIARCQNRN